MTIVAILIQEHKLIQRAIKLLNEISKKPRPVFIEDFVDFFRTYADRRHHGKEEDIFFKALRTKNMPAELKKKMSDLVEEHKKARQLVKQLEDLKDGPKKETEDCIRKISQLYTLHIEKENFHFFVPAYGLFNEKEKQSLLKSAQEFDRSLNHKDYKQMLNEIENALAD